MANAQEFVEIPELRHSEFSGGIITSKVFERLQPFIDQMNEQANQIDDWREKVIQRLRLPLLDQTIDPNGEYVGLEKLSNRGSGNTRLALMLRKRPPLIKRSYARLLLGGFM
jgi:hypothetical protein